MNMTVGTIIFPITGKVSIQALNDMCNLRMAHYSSLWVRRSMVDHRTVYAKVAGSSPVVLAKVSGTSVWNAIFG